MATSPINATSSQQEQLAMQEHHINAARLGELDSLEWLRNQLKAIVDVAHDCDKTLLFVCEALHEGTKVRFSQENDAKEPTP